MVAEAKVGTIGAVGSYTPPRSPGRYRGAGVGPSAAYSYSAAVAEVEVDPETGIVQVPTIWIGHDIGQAINPALVIGQVEGGVYMGLGEALMEEMATARSSAWCTSCPRCWSTRARPPSKCATW